MSRRLLRDNTCGSTVVLSVRHITVGVQETSGREQRRERDVSMENVVRDNYVKGLWIYCDLNALAESRAYEINQVVDFMRRTRQLIAYRRDVVIGLCHLYKCTPLNVLHWLHLLSIHSEYICSIYWIKELLFYGNLCFTLSWELTYMRYLLRYTNPHT